MLFDLKIYIREFSDSRPGNPRAPSFLGFSDVLSDETAIHFTLSDIENCRFLGFSDVNRTASLSGSLGKHFVVVSSKQIIVVMQQVAHGNHGERNAASPETQGTVDRPPTLGRHGQLHQKIK